MRIASASPLLFAVSLVLLTGLCRPGAARAQAPSTRLQIVLLATEVDGGRQRLELEQELALKQVEETLRRQNVEIRAYDDPLVSVLIAPGVKQGDPEFQVGLARSLGADLVVHPEVTVQLLGPVSDPGLASPPRSSRGPASKDRAGTGKGHSRGPSKSHHRPPARPEARRDWVLSIVLAATRPSGERDSEAFEIRRGDPGQYIEGPRDDVSSKASDAASRLFGRCRRGPMAAAPVAAPTVAPTAGELAVAGTRPAARRRALQAGGLALLGVGVAAAASGVALLVIDGQPTTSPQPPHTQVQNVWDTRAGGWAALVGGVAALGVGGALVGIARRRPSHRPPVSLAPLVAPAGAGLAVAGQF
jgi:hypothetical protein